MMDWPLALLLSIVSICATICFTYTADYIFKLLFIEIERDAVVDKREDAKCSD